MALRIGTRGSPLALAQTRQTRALLAAAHGLRESLVLLREASSEFGADPLNARLCRNRDQFVYEMSLLRRDGRVVRLVVDAASGARLSARQARER